MVISILTIAITSFMLIALSINVVRGRRKHLVALGSDGPFDMVRRIRAHANFVEYTPFFLALLAANEWLGLHWAILVLCSLIYLSGRVMHAYSLLFNEKYVDEKLTKMPKWRITGMMITFNTIGLLAIIAIFQIIAEKI